MIRLWSIAALALGVVALSPSPATAIDDCGGVGDVRGLARVIDASRERRIHIIADYSGAPCEATVCRSRAYLIVGDEVLTAQRQGRYMCVLYKPKGYQRHGETSGWVPADALRPLPFSNSPRLGAWGGHWVRDRDYGAETYLSIRALGGARLRVRGLAFFSPSLDAYERGDVHDGEVDQVVRTRKTLAGPLPPSAASGPPALLNPDVGCKIGLKLVGRWLVAWDDGTCGPNASFAGVYWRER